MKLIDYINNNKNWRATLIETPYSFLIHDEGPYTLIKYGFGLTDFSDPMCLEARGLIIRQDINNQYIPVCWGLNKFFNVGEPYAATIDWSDLYITQKVDGTNIRVWYDMGEWHLSTLGTINAFNDKYGKLFRHAIGNWRAFTLSLNPNYTYIFEVVSPFNHIVVHYNETAIYFISARNIISGQEYTDSNLVGLGNFKTLPRYFAHSLNECLNILGQMENIEGMVVCDKHFNRIKLKTEWYVNLHYIRGNGVCTLKRVVNMWRADELDDFMAYFPEYNEFITPIVSHLNQLCLNASNAAKETAHLNFTDRKQYAIYLTDYFSPLVCSYCFARLKDPNLTSQQYYKENVLTSALIKYLKPYIKTLEYGEIEDE